jgi:hypothetical protein
MKVGSASTSLSEDCLYQAVSFSPSERGEPYEGGRAVMRLAFTNTGLFSRFAITMPPRFSSSKRGEPL